MPSVLLFSQMFAQGRSQENAQRALWSNTKRMVLSEEGQKYFEENVQDALLPRLKGTVVTAKPTKHPQVIVLALSDKATLEVRLHLIKEIPHRRSDRRPASFNGPIYVGDEVEFMGIAKTFTKDPFMITFDVAVELTHIPQSQVH